MHDFVKSEVADGSTVGLPSYNNLEGTEPTSRLLESNWPIKCFPGFTVFSPI